MVGFLASPYGWHICRDCINVRKAYEFGLKNVLVMPNFRQLRIVDINELQDTHALPYKLCTFSRVLKEKGIEDAINASYKGKY